MSIAQVNIDDGFLNLMTQDGTAKDDVKVPEGDLGTDIQNGFDEGKDLLVTIISAMGEEQVRFYFSSLIRAILIYVSTILRPSPTRRLLRAAKLVGRNFLA
jgi:hypothetical protein